MHSSDYAQIDIRFFYTTELNFQIGYGLLTEGEISRAEGFKDKIRRLHYVVGRSALRLAISSSIGCSPHDLKFCQHMYGKPYIKNLGLKFNLSHSDNIIVVALYKNATVGVDISRVLNLSNIDELVSEILSYEEKKIWNKLKSYEQTNKFYEIWCSKEAVVKAYGMGLFYDVRNIDFFQAETLCYFGKWWRKCILNKTCYWSTFLNFPHNYMLALSSSILPKRILYSYCDLAGNATISKEIIN